MEMRAIRGHYYLLLFLFLIILNIVIRIPCTPELGTDSFFIHALCDSISAHGHAQWVSHPLSYLGLYPFSYPSGVPFLISGINQCAGIDMPSTILITSTFLGILSIFTSYLMAKSILNDNIFKFLVAFSFSLSPIILKFTIFNISTRGLFLVLLPLFVWSLFKQRDSDDIVIKLKFLALSIVLFLTLASTHRMFWAVVFLWALFILIIISHNIKIWKIIPRFFPTLSFIFSLFIFILALIALLFPSILNVNTIILIKIPVFFALLMLAFVSIHMLIFERENESIRKFYSNNLAILALTLFLIQFTPLAPIRDLWYLCHDIGHLLPYTCDSAWSQMLNLFILLIGRLGIFFLLGIIGLIYIILKGNFDHKKAFLAFLLITFLPFFHRAPYYYQFSSFIFCVFAAFILSALFNGSEHIDRFVFLRRINFGQIKISTAIIALILSFSVAFSGYTLIHRYNNPGNYMTSATENAGLFVKSYAPGININGIDVWRVRVVSGYYNFSVPKEVKIIPRKLSFSLADLGGYLRCPIGYRYENISNRKKELLWFGYTIPYKYQKYGLTNKIYCNGEKNIWYIKEHKWRYLSLSVSNNE